MPNLPTESEAIKEAPTVIPFGLPSKLASMLLLFLPFLLPLFFIPSATVPFQFSKMILVSIIVLVSFALWLLSCLKDGQFVFPSVWIFLAGGAVFIATLLSALFSGATKIALVGQVIEPGTAGFLGIMFLLMFLVACLFRSQDKIFYAYLLFFGAFFLVAGFHILRLFYGANFLSWGILTNTTSNLLGAWNDLAVFSAIATLLSLVTLELISLSRLLKSIVYLTLFVSLFLLVVVNFSIVWYVLAFFSLIFFVYVISFSKSETNAVSEPNDAVPKLPTRKLSATSFLVLVISLTFILGGDSVGNFFANKFNVSQFEVRPSWAATYSIAKDVFAKDPLLGSGPNRFAIEWARYKPDGVNNTPFWNTDFNFGYSLILTYFIASGFLGILAWLVFLGLYLFTGFKAILFPVKDKVSRYLVSSSFLVSFFLWIINFFYIPGSSIVALTFFSTGLFIATLVQSEAVRPKVISFIDDPKKSFASVLVLVLLLIGAVAVGYLFVEKFMASVYFQKGIIAFNAEGNIKKAADFVNKASAFDGNSAYYRSLAQIDMVQMQSLLSQNAKTISVDVAQAQFQTYLRSALEHAQLAQSADKSDYQNWATFGQIYEMLVPLKLDKAYESAESAYKEALARNPKSPLLLLTLARLNATHGDTAKAKNYITQALQQKNNYTDAIFLLTQIQIAEGNIKDAINSVQAVSILSPNDSGVFFQLGFLRYNNKDFEGTVSAMQQALTINPSYANAKYFLGLSLSKLGRDKEAIAQFKDLKATNPDNAEVDLILKNLTAGRSPFTNAVPPIDSQPEKRSKSPVSETKKADVNP